MSFQRTAEALPHGAGAGDQFDYLQVRALSTQLCEPLATEDYGVQPMPDASPPKWHLAHTTWFFETFILCDARFAEQVQGYECFNPAFEYLFNSYYNGVGEQFPREQRGNLSRPTLEEVLAYRAHVDAGMLRLLQCLPANRAECSAIEAELLDRVTLGLHHEQQHQELLLTDLKYNLGHNPLYPAYLPASPSVDTAAVPLEFVEFTGGIVSIGADAAGTEPTSAAESNFCFDNEQPQHDVLLQPFALANRPVTNGEYLKFVEAGAYQRSDLWLANAWSLLATQQWQAPLYWVAQPDGWYEYHLRGGLQPLDLHAPVCHISFYEAQAYARFVDARLPTEFEWEHAARSQPLSGNFVGEALYKPASSGSLYGDVWEWTASSYGPYPGYVTLAGTLGEYNGKFMSEQLVLRGGSCFTSRDHMRSTYRNFFYPPDRWQMSGLRLARALTTPREPKAVV